MRSAFVFLLLAFVRIVSRIFYRHDWAWVGAQEADPWRHDFRLVAILNHTSLYEFLFAGGVPWSFLRRMAWHGVLPIADKTLKRPLVGTFWKLIVSNVVAVSRERDQTWERMLASIAPDSMVMILPEGRMKRATGLDLEGNPMTIRGGIADIIRTIPEGRMLIAYSQGLHHIQVPGQLLPRLFKTTRVLLESVDIATYRAGLTAQATGDGKALKKAIVADLTRRRDLYCVSDLVDDASSSS